MKIGQACGRGIGSCAVGLLFPLLSSCANVDDGPYTFSKGWVHARVETVLAGEEITRPNFWRCLRGEAAAGRFGKKYVILAYRIVGKTRRHLVEIPRESDLKPGQRVLGRIDDCRAQVMVPDSR